jgi:hypothetical protein
MSIRPSQVKLKFSERTKKQEKIKSPRMMKRAMKGVTGVFADRFDHRAIVFLEISICDFV